jgi:hypothetical protein
VRLLDVFLLTKPLKIRVRPFRVDKLVFPEEILGVIHFEFLLILVRFLAKSVFEFSKTNLNAFLDLTARDENGNGGARASGRRNETRRESFQIITGLESYVCNYWWAGESPLP